MTTASSAGAPAPATGELPEADLAPDPDDLDGRVIATIRMLSADAVQAANSGHPGMPMGMAAPAWVLWSRFLRFDPARPDWPDRDRFVLSAGHGSMLLYSLLHLTGFDLPMDELRNFRQWESATPGHPEYGHTPGVETTTGPLGQGFGNAVGMALAERMLAERYNREGHSIVDHRTFAIASDGDLMEGVSHEAASLAGHLGLSRLVVLYDDNHITIDGATDLSFSEDVHSRFSGYGWQTLSVSDANDLAEVDAALKAALDDDRPTLIAVRSHIGFGAPTMQDTSAAHGQALGEHEVRATKARFGWPVDETFHVPDDVRRRCDALAQDAGRERQAWEERFVAWAAGHPALAAQWERVHERRLPEGVDDALPTFEEGGDKLATRKASGKTLEALAPVVPELVGGSADLAGSNNTALPDTTDVAKGSFAGRVLHFGVREHAMGSVINGMSLHGGLRLFGGTFLVFSDYMRPAIRLAALMGQPAIYVFTHDSIGLGEDGPTHQPVEHLAALRAVPNLAVLRPADANETAQAWRTALRRSDGPTALVLTRQGLPILPAPPDGAVEADGAWVVHDADDPQVVLVATGSEVWVCRDAAALLADDGIRARVVSVPWRERLLASDRRDQILLRGVPRLVVEAATSFGWEGVAGEDGAVIGLERFGASAPGGEVLRNLGFSPQNVADAARRLVGGEDGG